MDLIFAVFIAALGVTLANSRALMPDYMLAERFVRHGVFKGHGHPDADAPAQFVARVRARERTAVLFSVLMVIPAIAFVLRLPQPTMGLPVMAAVAVAARGVTLAVLGAHEARQSADGPRVSRGRVVGLADLVPLWAVAVIVFAQVGSTAAATLLVDGPAWLPWALGGSIVVTAATGAMAAWLARQPQRAEDAIALAWSDSFRREDVVGLLMLGRLVTLLVCALLIGFPASGPVGIVAWGAMAVIGATLIIADSASRRRASQRLGQPGFSDAHR